MHSSAKGFEIIGEIGEQDARTFGCPSQAFPEANLSFAYRVTWEPREACRM